MMLVRLIGVDWSASESNRGVAIVDYSHESAALIELSACTARRTALRVIADASADGGVPCLIAIDAPLGWPVGLSQALTGHSAGEGLSAGPDEMFSRETDRFVRKRLNKRPLEVGANLIARTAHAANQFLRDLRRETSRAIPLLWTVEEFGDVGVIEVYPAATQIASGLRSPGEALGITDADAKCANEHVRDALWCVVAGFHFLRGECYAPGDVERSRREGWIWVKQRKG